MDNIKNEGILNLVYRVLNRLLNHFRGFLRINASSTVGRDLKIIGRNFIDFGTNIGIGDNCRIECYRNYLNQQFNSSILIGENCSFGNFLHIGAISRIEIGRGVLCGSNILIIDHSHGEVPPNPEMDLSPAYRPLISKGNIKIGDNVWIADGAKIMYGADIGEGCIIGANAIISKKIPPYSVCVGNNEILYQ